MDNRAESIKRGRSLDDHFELFRVEDGLFGDASGVEGGLGLSVNLHRRIQYDDRIVRLQRPTALQRGGYGSLLIFIFTVGSCLSNTKRDSGGYMSDETLINDGNQITH